MSAIRSSENAIEVSLRRALHARGLRYRKYRRDLPGTPDIVFPTQRVVVFVDGDFWHCRILVERGLDALRASLRTPRRDYWLRKFERRAMRDDEVTAALQSNGWYVLRLWESDVKRDITAAAQRIEQIVDRQRAPRNGTS